MAFNSNTPENAYISQSNQTIFTFDFKIYVDTDLKVYRTNLDNTIELINVSLYTISGVSDTGGTVTFINPQLEGVTIVLQRVLDIDRTVEYVTNGDLYANTINTDQDYQTYLIADANNNTDKAMRLPNGAAGVSLELPLPLADQYLRWNDQADALINDGIMPTAVKEALDSAGYSEASRLTSDSYAVEAEDVFVQLYTYDPITETISNADTTDYSAYHFSQKSDEDGELRKWESEAQVLTANSYAVEPSDIVVKTYVSNGDGTFTPTDTTDYSALHWGALSDEKFNEFRNIYYGSFAVEPTERPDTTPIQDGDMFFDSTVPVMKVWQGTIWISAASAVQGTSRREAFIATQDQTVFTITGGYDALFIDVYVDGIKLLNGTDVDVTTGTIITLSEGVNAGTDVDTVAYGTFTVADVYTKLEIDGKIPLYSVGTDGLVLVNRNGGNAWEEILGLPDETGKLGMSITTDGVKKDSKWVPITTNPNILTENYTMTVGTSGSVVTGFTIADGVTLTIPDGSVLSVV